MNPRCLMPMLALAFGALGLWRAVRAGPRDPAARTWLLMAAVFAFVGLWLHNTPP